MRLGVRGKLFVISILIVLVAVVASTVYFESEVRDWAQRQIAYELRVHAGTVRAFAREGLPEGRADDFARRMAALIEARVTVIGADGVVIGDSHHASREMDNHAARPEVQRAHDDGFGSAIRHSDTIGEAMLYVAVPVELSAGEGTIRVARSLRDVNEAVAGLRVALVVAGLIGFVGAVLVSLVASHYLSRTLRALVEDAQRLAESPGTGKKLRIASSDELGGLAGSINRLAGDLERNLETLSRERARFKSILEGLGDAVIAVGDDRRVTMVNRVAVELLGVKRAQVGRELVEAVRSPALHELFQATFRGEPGAAEFDLAGPPRRIVAARAALLPGEGGVVVALRDITDLRRLENVRRDFVANVSHELRTPVGIIRANAETLLDGALEQPEMARRFLEALVRAADRLANLVNDLLEISRIESGRYHLDPDYVRLLPIVKKIVESLEPLAREKEITLEVTVDDDLVVWGDASALDHILLNLIDNAVKYTQKGGQVRILAQFLDAVEDAPDRVRVEVRDNGPGIEAVHRPRVFERFYRVDPGRSRSVGGTGLGLAIVKHLVDAQRGRVGVDPVLPRGSCFWIELPVHEVDA